VRVLGLMGICLGVVACSSGNGGNGDGGLPGESCNITLTGSVTDAVICGGVSLLFNSNGGTSTFSVGNSDDTDVTVNNIIVMPGEPQVTTFDAVSSDVNCTATVSNTQLWRVHDNGASLAGAGVCKLTFTQVTPDTTVGSHTTYFYEGTMNATLPAHTSGGATGEVQVVITFKKSS
jgi:hypothetical protein